MNIELVYYILKIAAVILQVVIMILDFMRKGFAVASVLAVKLEDEVQCICILTYNALFSLEKARTKKQDVHE